MKHKFRINPEGYKPLPVDTNEANIIRRRALDAFEEAQMRRELRDLGIEIDDINPWNDAHTIIEGLK